MHVYTPTRADSAFARLCRRCLLPAVAVATLTACGDHAGPVAPHDQHATSAGEQKPNTVVADTEALDVIDALERLAPTFGSTGAAARLRGALARLAAAARSGDAAASRTEAVTASLALGELELVGGPELGAEIDAVRLVIDARK